MTKSLNQIEHKAYFAKLVILPVFPLVSFFKQYSRHPEFINVIMPRFLAYKVYIKVNTQELDLALKRYYITT